MSTVPMFLSASEAAAVCPQLPTALQARTIPARNWVCLHSGGGESWGAARTAGQEGSWGGHRGEAGGALSHAPPGPAWHQCCLPASQVSPVPDPPHGAPAAPGSHSCHSFLCDPVLACPSAPKCRPPLFSGTAAHSLLIRSPLPPSQMPPGTSPLPFLKPVLVASAAAGGA